MLLPDDSARVPSSHPQNYSAVSRNYAIRNQKGVLLTTVSLLPYINVSLTLREQQTQRLVTEENNK